MYATSARHLLSIFAGLVGTALDLRQSGRVCGFLERLLITIDTIGSKITFQDWNSKKSLDGDKVVCRSQMAGSVYDL